MVGGSGDKKAASLRSQVVRCGGFLVAVGPEMVAGRDMSAHGPLHQVLGG